MQLLNLLDFLNNPFASLGTFIWVLLAFVALKNVWQSTGRTQTNQILWTALIFIFPIGGVILWWIFGGKRMTSENR